MWFNINSSDFVRSHLTHFRLAGRQSCNMKLNLYCAIAFCALALAAPPGALATTTKTTAGAPVCLPTTAVSPSELDPSWSEAQRQLGQGIASFDEGRLAVAAEHIKRALRIGLDAPLERATANKYLALVYCSHKSSVLCRKHFEAAAESSPDIAFDDAELRTALHRQSLADARTAIAKRRVQIVASTNVNASPATASSSAKSKSSQSGTLHLDVRPWAEVRINDKTVAVTPPSKTITLEAGDHQLVIRNPAGPPLRREIHIPVGGSVELAHRF
jgi:tetratricopeptide (TPR) repeat protein